MRTSRHQCPLSTHSCSYRLSVSFRPIVDVPVACHRPQVIKPALSLLVASLLCTACNNAAIGPSESLVGANDLPPAKALSRETLYIGRGGGAYGGDALTYEWRPDDLLTVTHTFSDNSARQTIKGRETFRVVPEIAARVRKLLWRVRPPKLEGVEQDQRPLGCKRQGPHDFGEVTVGFVNEGNKPGIEDDQVGIFSLPDPQSCDAPLAVEAREVVWHALRLLPKSKVAAGFERTQ